MSSLNTVSHRRAKRAKPKKRPRTGKRPAREDLAVSANRSVEGQPVVVGEEELSAEGLRLLEEAREERRAGERFFTADEIKREFDL